VKRKSQKRKNILKIASPQCYVNGSTFCQAVYIPLGSLLVVPEVYNRMKINDAWFIIVQEGRMKIAPAHPVIAQAWKLKEPKREQGGWDRCRESIDVIREKNNVANQKQSRKHTTH